MTDFKNLSVEEKIGKSRARRLEDCPRSCKRLLASCWSKNASPRQAIKAFCEECVGYDRAAVAACTAYACPLEVDCLVVGGGSVTLALYGSHHHPVRQVVAIPADECRGRPRHGFHAPLRHHSVLPFPVLPFPSLVVTLSVTLSGHSKSEAEWSGGGSGVRSAASIVSALSGVVANGRQTMTFVSSTPSKIPYGGFSPVRLQTSARRDHLPTGCPAVIGRHGPSVQVQR
jgi:hypothetical protein